MLQPLTTVFLWTDSHQEKTMVAASASSDSVEVYYALENQCSRYGSSCTVSSQTWFDASRRYEIEEYLAVADDGLNPRSRSQASSIILSPGF